MDIVKWLLEGDIAIQYQTWRDLLGQDRPELQNDIAEYGFAKRLLDLQQDDGHWGGGYYRKKWISTHYTLMELRRLEVPANTKIMKAVNRILDDYREPVDTDPENRFRWRISDVCMNGMLIHAFAFFKAEEDKLIPIIDFILSQQLPDGGYNCEFNRPGKITTHSSLHSTLSLIEGMNTYINQGYTYRKDEMIKQRGEAIEFLLRHKLFKSDRTGQVIKPSFTMLSFPPRWKYDILKALDALREAQIPYDNRMDDAIRLLLQKRLKDGTWPLQQKYPGAVHFDMEKTGSGSRMNTLRVLRVLKYFRPEIYERLDLD